ncbi:hypothetical protein K461DRAFT_256721 [Myriangium duriaei CBS 260.36]|uniref:Endoplasmic reticulum-based factor for assembly of V-ATPase-domain-containing protein n=1 Tax=Myriangium duriaei CBS 260.36 TaxID=1168546 RepID=A0A9P4J1G7_9PEZI|nr:hypothetical protein K461DRAFT_256721 [Myriangium duriaei CBS 260.36]
MVFLTITPATLRALKARAAHTGSDVLEKDGEPKLSKAAVGDPISHSQLIDLSKSLKEYQCSIDSNIDCACGLEMLLKGAKVYVPPPEEKPAKSPGYIQLMNRLREEEERRAYERMINPPSTADNMAMQGPIPNTFGASMGRAPVTVEIDEATFSDINRQMTLIINVLVTIIACSVGIWITAWHWATPARLALSLFGSGAVAVAEVVIYLGYIKRVSDAKSKEVQTMERKEVVETWVFDSTTGRKTLAGGRDETLRQRRGKHR